MNKSPTLESIDEKTFDRAWKLFTEFGVGERHFNDLQSTYRNLASTWLLGAFAAIGYVITQNVSIVPLTLLIAGISFVASIGIVMLWNIDLLVYHRLLDAYFTEGLKIEQEYNWLPKVRTNMMRLHNDRGILPRVVWFYMVANITLLVITGVALGIWAHSRGIVFVLLCLAVLFVFTIIVNLYMYKRTSNTDSFQP